MRRALVVTIGILFAILTALPLLAPPAPASGLSMTSLVGFSLSANPDTTSVQIGTTTTVTISVSSQGLSGQIDLSATVSSRSGPVATLSPSTVTVLPGGGANSTLTIDATTAQSGVYNVVVTGSSLLASSQTTGVVANVTTVNGLSGSPPSGANPPTGSPPPSDSGSTGNSGSTQGPTSTTTSTRNPKGLNVPNGGDPPSTSSSLAVLVAGNLLAAIATAAALGSLRKKKQSSLSSWQ